MDVDKPPTQLYAGLMAAIGSARVPQGIGPFEDGRGNDRDVEESAHKALEDALNLEGFELVDLKQLSVELGLSDNEKPNSVIGTVIYDHYERSHSPLVELFKEGSNILTGSYNLLSGKGTPPPPPKEPFFRRELALWPKEGHPDKDEYGVVHDILRVMGYRRTELFSPDFALRAFSVALPPTRLSLPDVDKAEPEEYLAVPVLTFIRRPGRATFRRTFSAVLVLVPIAKSVEGTWISRRMNAREINGMSRRPYWGGFIGEGLPKFKLAGLLEQYLGLRQDAGPSKFTVPELLAKIIEAFLSKIYALANRQNDELADLAYDAVRASWQFTSAISADLQLSGDQTTLSKWLQGKDPWAQRVADLVGFGPAVSSDPVYTYSLCVFSEFPTNLMIGFYNPLRDYGIQISSESYTYKEFGGSHNLAHFGWTAFMAIMISSLKQTILSYNNEVTGKANWKMVQESAIELVDDSDEVYDMDFMVEENKAMYEKVRGMAGLDNDFKNLQAKVDELSLQISSLHEISQNDKVTLMTAIAVVLTVLLSSTNLLALVNIAPPYPPWAVAGVLAVSAVLAGLVLLFMRFKPHQ